MCEWMRVGKGAGASASGGKGENEIEKERNELTYNTISYGNLRLPRRMKS